MVIERRDGVVVRLGCRYLAYREVEAGGEDETPDEGTERAMRKRHPKPARGQALTNRWLITWGERGRSIEVNRPKCGQLY